MKKAFYLLWIIYIILVFLPIGFVITVIISILTILFAFVGDYRWCYMPAKYWGRIMCYLAFVRVEVRGRENYDKNKSYIFIANHQSAYDIFVVYGWLINKFKWIMKSSLRKIPFVGLACHKAGHIFVDRSNPRQAKRSIEDAEKKLQNGSSIVVFPEGSRSKTGKLGAFKRGAFKIAQDLHLPIVPISIKGAFDVMSPSDYFPKPGRIVLTFHPEIPTDNLCDANLNEFMEHCRSVVASAM